MSPPLPHHNPHSRSVIAPRIPPSDVLLWERKTQTGQFPRCCGDRKQICWVYFGKALRSESYFTTRMEASWQIPVGVEPLDFTSACRNTAQRPGSRVWELLPSAPELLDGCFQTQWVHLSGQAQCEKRSPKCFQPQSRIKGMKRRGRERMSTACSQGMLALAKLDRRRISHWFSRAWERRDSVHRRSMWRRTCGVMDNQMSKL